MSTKPIYKVYSIIILCVAVSALSVFSYVKHQNTTQQSVEIKYNPLTEAEKAIVEKNIKDKIAQQKQERRAEEMNQKKDASQYSKVDESSRERSEFNSPDMDREYENKRPSFIDSQTDEIQVKKTKQKQQSHDSDASVSTKKSFDLNFNPLDPSTLPHSPKMIGGREFEVKSVEELEELIAKWGKSGDPKLKAMAGNLKRDFSKMGDDVNIVIKVAD